MEGTKTPEQVLAELGSIENDLSKFVVTPTPEKPIDLPGAKIESVTPPVTEPVKTEPGKVEPTAQTTAQQQGAKMQETVKALLKGTTAVNFADIIICRVAAFGTRLAGLDATVSDYKLTEAEKNQIAPFLEVYLADLSWLKNLTPGKQLAIIIFIVYAFKVSEVYEKQDERKRKKSGVKKDKPGIDANQIKTTDGRPFSRATHFMNGKPKKLEY